MFPGDDVLRELARRLSMLQGERYAGALITEAVWRKGSPKNPQEPLRILRDCHGFFTVEVWNDCGTLTVTMLLNHRKRSIPPRLIPRPCQAAENERMWHVFFAGEVAEFTAQAGDTNVLHRGEHPVVPGLLMLECLLADERFRDVSRLQMKFRQAAFAGDALYLSLAGDAFQIFSARQLLCEGHIFDS